MGGEDDEAPACPEPAPRVVFEGGDGLSTRQQCPSCACTAPECVLPPGLLVWNVKFCDENAPGAMAILLGPPEGWDGSCYEFPPQPETLYRSWERAGTSLTPCEVITGPEPMVAEIVWSAHARACAIDEPAKIATAATTTPFTRCVWQDSEVAACPESFPVRKVFFEGAEGSLGCSPCTCGEPEGSRCRSRTGYDPAPGCNPDVWGMYPSELGPGSCGTPVTDEPGIMWELFSMYSEWEINTPGTCPPAGGAPLGEVAAIGPATFCCEAER